MEKKMNIYRLLADLPLTPTTEPTSGPTQRTFMGTAYAGGAIPDFGIIIDLKTITVADKLPLLFQHDHDKIIGIIDNITNNGNAVVIAGSIFSDIDETAAEVVAKAGKGVQYQLSLGIWNSNYTTVKDPLINGNQFSGPYNVLQNGIIREVSVVALGADANTNVNFFNAKLDASILNPSALSTTIQETSNMEQSLEINDLTSKLNEAIKRAEAAEAALSAKLKSEREETVKSLFGVLSKEYNESEAKAYLDLTPEQFHAVSQDIRNLKASLKANPPDYLFSEQAIGSVEPPARFNTTSIYANRTTNKVK